MQLVYSTLKQMSKHISRVLPLSTYSSSSSLSLSKRDAQTFGLLEAIPTKHKKPYKKQIKNRKYSITYKRSTAALPGIKDIATTLKLNKSFAKMKLRGTSCKPYADLYRWGFRYEKDSIIEHE
jgi:hypothetical protein